MEKWTRGSQAACSGEGRLSFLSQGQAAPDSHEKEEYAFSQGQALCKAGRRAAIASQCPRRKKVCRDSQLASWR